MNFARQEAILYARMAAGEFVSSHRKREERRTRKVLEDLENPPPNVREYIAEAGTALLEAWKQKTRTKIAGARGKEVHTPRVGEDDSIVYPLHVVLLERAVRPFVDRIKTRHDKIIKMLVGTGLNEEQLQLYRSMSLREQRIEDQIPPCPSSFPTYPPSTKRGS
jgi:hypothetical protein